MKLFRKIVRRFALAILILGVLGTLFVAEENWRGHRVWAAYKNELEAEGFRFGAKALRDAPITDDQNFAKTPVLQPFFQYVINPATGHYDLQADQARPQIAPPFGDLEDPRKTAFWQAGEIALLTQPQVSEIMKRLAIYARPLEQISNAARQRPFARYPSLYEEGIWMPLSQLTVLQNIIATLNLRASAEVALAQGDRACDDIETSLRLSDFLKSPAILATHASRTRTFLATTMRFWEGARLHCWSESQLCSLEDKFAQIHVFPELARATRGQIAFSELCNQSVVKEVKGDRSFSHSAGWNSLFRFLPIAGWMDQILTVQVRSVHDQFLHAFDPTGDRVFPAKGMKEPAPPFLVPSALVGSSLGYFPSELRRSAYAAQTASFARLACALERSWLSRREYPSTLDQLVPAFINDLPHDVCNGESLHYRLDSNGGYRIWSVGWNLQDDKGVSNAKHTAFASINLSEGDWVWIMPGAADSAAATAQ